MTASDDDAARAAVILGKAFTTGIVTKDETKFFLRVLSEMSPTPSLLECHLWWGAAVLALLVQKDVEIRQHLEA